MRPQLLVCEHGGEISALGLEMGRRFDAMQGRLYAMQRLMIQFCGGALVTLIGLLFVRL